MLTGKIRYRIGFLGKMILQVEDRVFRDGNDPRDMEKVGIYRDASFEDYQRIQELDKNKN